MINEKDIDLFAKLFDEKLRGIHIKMDAEFTVVNSELRQIKEQTLKTNSRVNHVFILYISLYLVIFIS